MGFILKKSILVSVAILAAVTFTGCADIPRQTTTYAKAGVTSEQAARDTYLCAGNNDRPYFTDQCMERKGYQIVRSDES